VGHRHRVQALSPSDEKRGARIALDLGQHGLVATGSRKGARVYRVDPRSNCALAAVNSIHLPLRPRGSFRRRKYRMQRLGIFSAANAFAARTGQRPQWRTNLFT